jgi:hypothetical protein
MMDESNPGETRPSRPAHIDDHRLGLNETQPIQANPPHVRKPRNSILDSRSILWIILAIVMLGLGSATGGLAAYRSAIISLREEQDFQSVLALTDQFNRGISDLNAGQFESARQRFEFILSKDPNFPGAAEKLAEVKQILFATATPTPTPTQSATPTATATITPTPTLDPRPLQELFSVAEGSLSAGDWNRAIETLLAMRASDPGFETAQVDGMLFISLQKRGLDRILNGRDLEGGAYDLSLAENFGPLDSQAAYAREMVRLYMYGSAFWEAYPEQAVFYFGQVASAAPYLTDASGWTAAARYRASLIQFGDDLAEQEEWCSAQSQYELALSWGFDEDLSAKADNAAYECSPPTITPTEEPPFTPTPEFIPSETPPPTELPSPTEPLPPTEPAPPTETSAPPTEMPTAQPDSPTPTQETPPTSTPSVTATEEAHERTETPEP